MRFLVLFLPAVLCLAQTCDTAPAHKRYAFVVGNGTYANLPVAPTAEADARAMQVALESAGFMVTPVKNGAMPDLLEKDLPDFLKKVQPGDVVFFYYSGHIVGGPVGSEDDFILPENFDASKEVDSNLNALSLGRFLDELDDRQPGLTIVMIEGPHPVLGATILGSRVGLIDPDLSNKGKVLFAMSAEPGRNATTSESGSATSLFTRTAAGLLGQPGLRLSELFKQAQDVFVNQSGRIQVPFVKDLSGGDFCFHEAIAPPPPPPPPKPEIKIETRIETVPIPSNTTDHEEYVRISHGTFKMGCVPSDSRCKPDEKPPHEVTLSKDFYIGRNEVKVSSYRLFQERTKRKKKLPGAPLDYDGWKNGELPQVRVTWEDASAYCQWAGGRLPTEAEWEYAARAGGSDEIYPLNSENSRDKANFYGRQGNDIYDGVAPVRRFDPNNFKLYDMSGNVWEWVSDWYDPKYYAVSPAVDPKGPTTGRDHIVRGGSFDSDPKDHLRLSLRFLPPKSENLNVGFRCVLDDTPATSQLLK